MSQLAAVDISDSDRFELAEVLKEESESSSVPRPLEDILEETCDDDFDSMSQRSCYELLAARNRVARSLALADYIDRPVGDADDAERSRLDMAMSLREAVSESVAAERELLRDCDISGKRGLLDLCDFTEALGLDVKYYNEEYPAVEQCAARDLADKIDVQTCRYVRERVGVWICDKCGHDEGKYGAHSYRHCPICGRVIEKTVGK